MHGRSTFRQSLCACQVCMLNADTNVCQQSSGSRRKKCVLQIYSESYAKRELASGNFKQKRCEFVDAYIYDIYIYIYILYIYVYDIYIYMHYLNIYIYLYIMDKYVCVLANVCIYKCWYYIHCDHHFPNSLPQLLGLGQGTDPTTQLMRGPMGASIRRLLNFAAIFLLRMR